MFPGSLSPKLKTLKNPLCKRLIKSQQISVKRRISAGGKLIQAIYFVVYDAEHIGQTESNTFHVSC